MLKSIQPRKQRKRLYDALLHDKQKLVGAHLSKELRKDKKKRSLPIRKGDRVKIVRGMFKGKSGKVVSVKLVKMKIFVEGMLVKKQSGKEVLAAIQPSNVIITELTERK